MSVANLSPAANARTFGFLVAAQSNFTVTPVTEIQFATTPGAAPTTMPGAQLQPFRQQFTYQAGKLKP